MAWRASAYLIEGELDNTHLGKVTGWMRFAGMKEKVTFDLEGDFHRDIRGAKIRFTGPAFETDPPADAESGMDGFGLRQTGKVGDITAGLPPADYVSYPYIEWYSDENGRVLLELEPAQVEVIGTPIPACESEPISRQQQEQNMAQFLGEVAAGMNLPQEQAICVSGDTVIKADKPAANDRMRGMKLLTQEIRKKLPPLYAQESKGGKAVVHIKYFTPESSWTWYIAEGSPVTDESGKEVDFKFFGLVDGHFKEMGYVMLSELETTRGPLGLPIERDLHWQPKTLEEIAPEMFAATRERRDDT
jgi:hypothetical protein